MSKLFYTTNLRDFENEFYLFQIVICCTIIVFKLYHKTCDQFYRCFGLYEKSPNSFLPSLPHRAVQEFSVLLLRVTFFLKMGIKRPLTFHRLQPVNGLIFGIRFSQTCRPQRIAAQTVQGSVAPLTEQSDETLSVIQPFSADRE